MGCDCDGTQSNKRRHECSSFTVSTALTPELFQDRAKQEQKRTSSTDESSARAPKSAEPSSEMSSSFDALRWRAFTGFPDRDTAEMLTGVARAANSADNMSRHQYTRSVVPMDDT